MDFENLKKQAEAADGFLGVIGNILKKRWWILLLILLGWLFWWGWNNPEPDYEKGYSNEQYNNDDYSDDLYDDTYDESDY